MEGPLPKYAPSITSTRRRKKRIKVQGAVQGTLVGSGSLVVLKIRGTLVVPVIHVRVAP